MMRSIKQQNPHYSQTLGPNGTAAGSNSADHANGSSVGPTSPICRCRVTYLGSAVPYLTKDGLQGIQEPLHELYPDEATLASGDAGIDSWLSVWSNGILIENVDDTGREVKRFFKIEALHYCAAVKFVPLPMSAYQTLPNGSITPLPKFLPLDSIHARQPNPNPPLFASILRRTTGVKVLECHAFICKREAAANALVRCCFHAYADTMYSKQIGADIRTSGSQQQHQQHQLQQQQYDLGHEQDINNNGNNHTGKEQHSSEGSLQDTDGQSVKHYDTIDHNGNGLAPIVSRRSKSMAALNDVNPDNPRRAQAMRPSDVEAPTEIYGQANGRPPTLHRSNWAPLQRRKSVNDNHALDCDSSEDQQLDDVQSALRRQQKLSKSMHQLSLQHREHDVASSTIYDRPSRPINGHGQQCAGAPDPRWPYQGSNNKSYEQQVPPFYNPHAGRVPSYPPPNMDVANQGGTMKSIRSMAAHSIASTLLRSKKHAKAMSIAQLNQDKVISFHQPHLTANTMAGPILMPPVPPMFMPNMPTIIDGSQTMVPRSQTMLPMMKPPINFETMKPKDMKKLLKKSIKHGIDPALLPLPMQGPSKSSTMIPQSIYSHSFASDMSPSGMGPHSTGMNSMVGHSTGVPMHPLPTMDNGPPPMKPILLKPNPDFIKSKAGKKWLKQQREFKKLLPPHLDGLPIVFGPPPLDMLEVSSAPQAQSQYNMPLPPPQFIPGHQSGVPYMNSSGYYNSQPIYGQNGHISAASTLSRHPTNNDL